MTKFAIANQLAFSFHNNYFLLPFSGNVYLNLFYLSHAQVEYGELIKHKKDFLLRSKKFFDRITDSTWKEKGKNKKAYSL